jgi:hypothetical protein
MKQPRIIEPRNDNLPLSDPVENAEQAELSSPHVSEEMLSKFMQVNPQKVKERLDKKGIRKGRKK